MAERAMILPCFCNHKDQDEMYGSHMRVHNTNANGYAFCTVCSPSYRRNKNQNAIAANLAFKQFFVSARGSRNPKKVEK